MTKEEKREQVIQSFANMLRTSSFGVEVRVKDKPAAIKIIVEMTQEEWEGITDRTPYKTVS